MKLKLKFIVLFIIPLLAIHAQKSHEFYVANWNVQNLFDTVDDPDKRDEEFTPGSEINWTEERLNVKLENLAKVISDMNDGKGPDIIAFEEVEHKSLLQKILERLKSKSYSFVYFESPDKRGIDNGIMYDTTVFKVLNTEAIEVLLPSSYPTRYISYAEFQLPNGETLHFFANHWPSRRGGLEKSEPNRIAAAETLRNKLDMIFQNEPEANVIITGDFNDEPNNKSIERTLGAKEFRCNDKIDGELFNLAYTPDKNGAGTFMYRGSFNMLDQIIISSALYDGKGVDYKCDSFEIFNPSYVIQKSGKYKGAILPTYGGRKYLNGYSDHFPVGAHFIYE